MKVGAKDDENSMKIGRGGKEAVGAGLKPAPTGVQKVSDQNRNGIKLLPEAVGAAGR